MKQDHTNEIAALNNSFEAARSVLQEQLATSDEYLSSNITAKKALQVELLTEQALTANLTS